MRTHSPQPRHRLIAFLLASLLTWALPTIALAAPTNAAIEAKRAEAEKARQRLDSLAEDLEMRSEEYHELQAALAETRTRISETEARLEVARSREATAEALLGRRAASIYRNGPTNLISVIVGISDFQDLVSRLDLMRRVGRNDAALVASVRSARAEVETNRQALESRREEQVSLVASARQKATEVQAVLDEQASYLATVDAELTRLIAEERVRQERLARERARRAAARASLKGSTRSFDPSKLGGPHRDAVAVAKRYLGVRYVWGGTSPSGFDCSGLTWYAYHQVGIDLPRTSRSQFRVGAYIPPDRLDLLEPGDLVFFGRDADQSRIHHVGMYVGGGDFIHAPQTGDVVRIQSLLGRIEARGDYVGACRP